MPNNFRPGVQSLRPSAAPVDTYVRPAQKAGPVAPTQRNPLMELAGALRSINPTLDKFIQAADTRERDQQIAEAGAAFDQSRKSWAKAVSDGDVPAGASPFFRKGYQHKAGKWEASTDYSASLLEGWQKSDLASKDFASEQDAVAALQDYLGNTRQKYLQRQAEQNGGKVDPDWYSAFNHAANGIDQQLIQQHIAARAKQTENKMESETRREIGDIFFGDHDVPQGIEKLFNGDPETDTGGLKDIGLTADKFGGWVLSEAQTSAESLAYAGHYQQARDVLAKLDQISDGKGGYIGNSSAGRKMKVDIEASLSRIQSNAESLAYSREQRQWAIADRSIRRELLEAQAENIPIIRKNRERAEKEYNDKEARDMMFAETLTDILASPEKDHEKQLEDLAKDTRYASLVSPLRSAWNQRLNANSDVKMTPDMVTKAGRMEVGIYRDETTASDILDAVKSRQIDASTMTRLLSAWVSQQRHQAQLEGRGTKIEGLVREGKGLLDKALSQRDMYGNEINGKLGVQAYLHYQDAMSEFLQDNPEASLTAVREKRNKLLKEITDDPIYRPTDSFSSGNVSIELPGKAKPTTPSPDWAQ